MSHTPFSPISIYYCSDPKDLASCQTLDLHLAPLKLNGRIQTWGSQHVLAGRMWQQEHEQHLSHDQVLILLLSPDFLAWDIAQHWIDIALSRHRNGDAAVIPILIRPCGVQETELQTIQILPRSGKALSIQPYPEEVWEKEVVAEINRIIELLQQRVFIIFAPEDVAIAEQFHLDIECSGIGVLKLERSEFSVELHQDHAIRYAIRNSSSILLLASPAAANSRTVKVQIDLASTYQRPIQVAWVDGKNWQDSNPGNWGIQDIIDARIDKYIIAAKMVLSRLKHRDVVAPSFPKHPPPSAEPRNPYKGLRSFTESDKEDFFGREALIDELANKLETILALEKKGKIPARLLAVLGASGSGKSSAVMAGLLPFLRRGSIFDSQDWIYLEPIVPGMRPLEALALSLAQQPVLSDAATLYNALALGDSLRSLHLIAAQLSGSSSRKVVLILDQFEEFFTTSLEKEQHHFFDLLITAVTEPQGPLLVVLTLRADFYDRLMQYHTLYNLLDTHRVSVLPMGLADLRNVIEQPARLDSVQITFEGDLVGDLLFETHERIGSLPLLQFTLDELFQRRKGRLLTTQAYQEIGGVKGALVKRADSTYTSLFSDEHRTLARVLFLHLVDLGQTEQDITRRRVSLTKLSFIHTADQKKMFQETVDAFIKARLLTTNRIADVPSIEISHESLIREWTRLADWLVTYRSDLLLWKAISEDVAEWIHRNRPVDRLYRGTQLDEAQAWVQRNMPNVMEDAMAFLHASAVQRAQEETAEKIRQAKEAGLQRKAARRQRYLIGMMGVTSLVLVVAIIIGLLYRQLQITSQELQRSFPANVTNLNDDGPGSLREAIAKANPGDVILFARNLKGTLTLTSGELQITKNLTISGPSSSSLIISGGNISRVFKIRANSNVTISSLTIVNGYTPDQGGCIYNSGTLMLTNSTISHCTALEKDWLAGGGIYNANTLDLVDSTVSENRAPYGYGGGIYNLSTLTLNRSTVSSNTAGLNGGGIDSGFTLTLTNSTISGNHAQEGGGILIGAGGSGSIFGSTIYKNIAYVDGGNIRINSDAPVKLYETIIAGGNASYGPDISGAVLFFEDGYNLLQNPTDATISGNSSSNLIGVSPKLDSLKNNGGPTKTHALLPGSPAIDQVPPGGECGSDKVLFTDQRGVSRPQGASCDIGAYEMAAKQ